MEGSAVAGISVIGQ